MATGEKNTYGPRRRYHGKRVTPNGLPRSSAMASLPGKNDGYCSPGKGGGKPPTYECGQTETFDTKNIPGRFRVEMPLGLTKFGTRATPILDRTSVGGTS